MIGVAGFRRPGVSRGRDGDDSPRGSGSARFPISKVILQDVRVLAVDQKLEEVKSGEPELVNVVTLEVDPRSRPSI